MKMTKDELQKAYNELKKDLEDKDAQIELLKQAKVSPKVKAPEGYEVGFGTCVYKSN